MEETKNTPKTIDEYISRFPVQIQKILSKLRKVIKKAAPNADEKISYQMPAFKQNGYLVYFAGFKNHIGFYPASSGIKAFGNELSIYKSGKGSVQFPIDKPLPFGLVTRIVKFRVSENTKVTNKLRKKN